MKTLQSTVEGVWYESKPMPISAEQRLLLRSTKPSDATAKSELKELIAQQSKVSPKADDKTTAVDKYTQVKPTVGPDDVYELISCEVFIADSEVTGILNCRINGDHKQVRF